MTMANSTAVEPLRSDLKRRSRLRIAFVFLGLMNNPPMCSKSDLAKLGTIRYISINAGLILKYTMNDLHCFQQNTMNGLLYG